MIYGMVAWVEHTSRVVSQLLPKQASSLVLFENLSRTLKIFFFALNCENLFF